MTITISAELERMLKERAASEGKAPDAVAESLLLMALEWGGQDEAEAIEGIQRGLDDFAAGRFRSFSDFAAEQRRKHQVPGEA
jgi:hypothetical protein